MHREAILLARSHSLSCVSVPKNTTAGSAKSVLGKRKAVAWSDDERAIFRRAREAFQQNWCRVAPLLSNHTCAECYMQSLEEGPRALTKNVTWETSAPVSVLLKAID